MLDQNLLDKQFILESLIDLLEKTSVSIQKSQIANSLMNENSTVKLLLSTSKFKMIFKLKIFSVVARANDKKQ